MIQALPDSYWKNKKLADLKEVIRGCLGIYLEATAADPTVTPGESVKLRLEAIWRAPLGGSEVTLNAISVRPGLFDTLPAKKLEANKGFIVERKINIPQDAGLTAPYWLRTAASNGMYVVENQELRGLPETPRYATVRWSLTLNGVPLEYETEVAWKTGEPAIGEVWRPFEVLPPVFVEFTESSYVFTKRDNTVTVRVKAGRDDLHCKLHLVAPAGWVNARADKKSPEFDLKKKGEQFEYSFMLSPAAGSPDITQLGVEVEVDGKKYSNRLVDIKYDHIPQQSVLLPAVVPASRPDLHVKAKNVGYYMGAGDDVPAALRQMGCTVTLLENQDMEKARLQQFDAIVIGIRAYNTKDELKFHHPKLLEYVQNGGTLVVQYHTSFELAVDQLAPYPMKLSRTRVTDETAEIRFRLPEHAVLNTPNKLNAKDFDGWVQERGLYFPGEWDAAFEAPLSTNDPGEKPADGALLVAKYGKGHYVYTGLSFFRELPAGVPGAYRLFANLISLGK